MITQTPWEARRPERELLLICFGGIGLGVLLVLASLHTADKPLGLTQLLPFLAYGLCLGGLHLSLVFGGSRSDQLLVVALAFLVGFGLLARARLGAFADGDAAGLGDLASLADYAFVGGFALLIASALGLGGGRYRTLGTGHWIWVWAAVSILLVLVLLVTGQRFRGAVFGAGLLTPTELLKLSFVLFSAAYIDREAKALSLWSFHGLLPPWRPLLPLAGVGAILLIMLLIQRDLGMVLLLGLTLPTLLVLGTGRWGYAGYGLALAGLLGWLLLEVFEHGERRIQAWLSPFQDPTGASWQVLQGLSGMYAGGLWGDGFGAGNPEYTPIAESDFIYAIIGEELGFVGTALVLAFFLILILRGLRIAVRARSPFGLLLATGLTIILAAQVVLNVGGVISFLPLTGITLPFISQGGSSLVTAFALLGLLLAISDGDQSRGGGARREVSRPRKKSSLAAPHPGMGSGPAVSDPESRHDSASAPGAMPGARRGPASAPGPGGPGTKRGSASNPGSGTRPGRASRSGAASTSEPSSVHGRGAGSPTRSDRPRRGP